MNPKVTTSIVIGIIIGTMLFPMILIPLMGIGVVIWALYLLNSSNGNWRGYLGTLLAHS
jgi:hypothetical protein